MILKRDCNLAIPFFIFYCYFLVELINQEIEKSIQINNIDFS